MTIVRTETEDDNRAIAENTESSRVDPVVPSQSSSSPHVFILLSQRVELYSTSPCDNPSGTSPKLSSCWATWGLPGFQVQSIACPTPCFNCGAFVVVFW